MKINFQLLGIKNLDVLIDSPPAQRDLLNMAYESNRPQFIDLAIEAVRQARDPLLAQGKRHSDELHKDMETGEFKSHTDQTAGKRLKQGHRDPGYGAPNRMSHFEDDV